MVSTYKGHINMKKAAPSVVPKGRGCLSGYRLDFVRPNKNWKGALATIVPHKGHSIMGAIWEVNNNEISLYKYNGILSNYFYPKAVYLRHLEIDKIINCLVFIQSTTVTSYIKHASLPPEKQPSEFYL
ncbi:unnamed protein product [Acanthoscelides obtectus]|uniref:Uncharacterized protein n=1 Tax=Acanthoscelides obtectus TaxID=200917 RepID=A0A9P0K1N5_ACAOB|nr:unnamed protein product [Acanthoscelides obtectus]CAK1648662.1 hypothetical protein AOBTE_LOCUS15809 [Acanthoscelides obtectus]